MGRPSKIWRVLTHPTLWPVASTPCGAPRSGGFSQVIVPVTHLAHSHGHTGDTQAGTATPPSHCPDARRPHTQPSPFSRPPAILLWATPAPARPLPSAAGDGSSPGTHVSHRLCRDLRAPPPVRPPPAPRFPPCVLAQPQSSIPADLTCTDTHMPRRTRMAQPSLHLCAHMRSHTCTPFPWGPPSVWPCTPFQQPRWYSCPPQQVGTCTSAPRHCHSQWWAHLSQQPAAVTEQKHQAPRAVSTPRPSPRGRTPGSSRLAPGKGSQAQGRHPLPGPRLQGSPPTLSPVASREGQHPGWHARPSHTHPCTHRTPGQQSTHQNVTPPQTHVCTRPQSHCTQLPTEPR